jgi:transposase
MKRRLAQIETSLVRYFYQLVQADHEESSVADIKTINLKDKIAALRGEMVPVIVIEIHMQNVPDNQVWHEVKGASV